MVWTKNGLIIPDIYRGIESKSNLKPCRYVCAYDAKLRVPAGRCYSLRWAVGAPSVLWRRVVWPVLFLPCVGLLLAIAACRRFPWLPGQSMLIRVYSIVNSIADSIVNYIVHSTPSSIYNWIVDSIIRSLIQPTLWLLTRSLIRLLFQSLVVWVTSIDYWIVDSNFDREFYR